MLAAELADGGIVVADYAAVLGDHICNRNRIGVVILELIAADGGWAGGIHRLYPIDQVLRNRSRIGIIWNLISQGPQDHGRIVLIPINHGLDAELRPGLTAGGAEKAIRSGNRCIEIIGEVVAISVFVVGPGVECLFNNQKTKFITDVNEILVSRVVAGSDGVNAHILHNGQLTVHGIVIGRAAQGALIVVQADAVQLHLLTIQGEASICIKAVIPEAKGGVIGVYHLTAYRQLRADCVKIGAVRRPKVGAADNRAGSSSHGLSSCYGYGGAGRIAGLHHGVGHSDSRAGIAVIDHIHSSVDSARAAGNVRGGHIGAV